MRTPPALADDPPAAGSASTRPRFDVESVADRGSSAAGCPHLDVQANIGDLDPNATPSGRVRAIPLPGANQSPHRATTDPPPSPASPSTPPPPTPDPPLPH